jgi:uncharacterized protein (TIGR03435 family)
MARIASLLLLVLAFSGTESGILAQARFDVASIRPNPDRSDPSFAVNPGGLIYARVSLSDCIEAAYGVKPYQISGPEWLRRENFDITAKAEGNHSRDELMRMLQTLLADRFKLALHHEQKEQPVYALVPGRNGPKLRPAEGEGQFSMGPAAGGIGFQKTSMSDFAGRFLSVIPMIGRPVLDKTGLPGLYDFTLQLNPTANGDAGAIKRAAAEEGFSLFVYALDQLGLRLESEKAAIDFLVVDHVERPSEN